jgi:hypothetical protein
MSEVADRFVFAAFTFELCEIHDTAAVYQDMQEQAQSRK